jgi:hypothetical protein
MAEDFIAGAGRMWGASSARPDPPERIGGHERKVLLGHGHPLASALPGGRACVPEEG